jgi:hypothetical protein
MCTATADLPLEDILADEPKRSVGGGGGGKEEGGRMQK